MTETLCRQDWLGLLEAEVERLRVALDRAELRLARAKEVDGVPAEIAVVDFEPAHRIRALGTTVRIWCVGGHKFRSLQRAQEWVRERQAMAEVAAVMAERRETC